jgi:uncharacterized protein (TIGR03435 family)
VTYQRSYRTGFFPGLAAGKEGTENEYMLNRTGKSKMQDGLQLESAKGPVEVIAVDHAERPSGN